MLCYPQGKLWIVCGRGDQRPNQLSKRWREDGRNPDDDGCKPDSGTVACRRNCGLSKSPQFLPQPNLIETNNSGAAQRNPE